MRALAPRLRGLADSVFDEVSALAQAYDAIDLGAATPTLAPPQAALAALGENAHQYSPVAGNSELRAAVARHAARFYGAAVDPESEVAITCGVTEGLQAAMFALLAPGDEVVLFDPAYDCYAPSVRFAGGVVRAVPLRTPDFKLDRAALAATFSPRTRALILNTPHNPTGKVFDAEELAMLADLCRRYDVTAVCDEVYEHVVFDDARHARLADLPGMAERTLTLGGAGKTFAVSGWRIGWAVGPAPLIEAINRFRQFSVFCAPTLLQRAVARALDLDDAAYASVTEAYRTRRDRLLAAFAGTEFALIPPQGGFFALAPFDARKYADARECCLATIRTKRVAPIPLDTFYVEPAHREPLVRFSFCASVATLEEAGRRLAMPS